MAGDTGRLIAFFARAEPRAAPPTGWALTLDAAVAVGAAIGAVYEMAEQSITRAVFVRAPAVSPFGFPLGRIRDVPGQMVITGTGGLHPSALLLAGAAMTALPLAVRRFYPIAVWLAIATAIVGVHSSYVPPVALGTAIYAAYSAITHSRYRNLSIAVVSLVTIVVAVTLGDEFPGSREDSPPSSRSWPPAWRGSASACFAAGWPTPPPGCAAPPRRRRSRPSRP